LDSFVQSEDGSRLYKLEQGRYVQVYPAVPVPPLPPVPSPSNDKSSREISRFWLALGFLGATVAAAFFKTPDWLTAVLATATANVAAFYFGEKKGRGQ
jgi:hypothetical protein